MNIPIKKSDELHHEKDSGRMSNRFKMNKKPKDFLMSNSEKFSLTLLLNLSNPMM